MARILIGLMVCLLVLTACNGAAPDDSTRPTDIADEQLADEAVEDSPPMVGTSPNVFAPVTPSPEATVDPLATRDPEDPTGPGDHSLEVALPGTLVASETEDPDANILFTSIRLERTGGTGGVPLTVEVFGDGRIIRNGAAGTISQDVIARLQDHIVTLNFFGMQGTYLGPGGDDTVYRYRLTVDREGTTRTINAMDGFIPREIQRFIGAIITA